MVADTDVVQAAVVAQGEFAVAVDAVFADAEVFADVDALAGGDGAGAGGPGAGGGAAVDAAVWALLVVVVAELVELGLQGGEGGRGVLAGEPVLQRLMQPFDLAAGLWVVGLGVGQGDAEGNGFTSRATQPWPR